MVAELTESHTADPSRAESSIAVLQAIADPVRWAVLDRLSTDCQCVCTLQEAIDIAPNLLSYHLKVLREAGLVTTARRGRWIDYSLAPDAPARMQAALPGAVPEPTPTPTNRDAATSAPAPAPSSSCGR
jgi:ArsR family transcriptional regulator